MPHKSHKLKSNINSFLTKKLPVHLQFEWYQHWGKLIVIRLENTLEKGETYEKFKISICPIEGVVLGMIKEELTEWDNNDDKWFGNEALLSEHNAELYTSSANVYVYDDLNGQNELFSYYWHGEFKYLIKGNLPKKLSILKLNKILNGKLFSKLYFFIKSV